MSFPWSIILPAPMDDGAYIPAASIPVESDAPAPIVYRAGAVIRDLLLDPTTGLWDLSRGDAVWAADEAAIRQQIDLRLQTQVGERIDDYALGIDYPNAVFGVGASQGQISAAFRNAILSVPGVRSITRLQITTANNVATVTWAVTWDLGLLSGQTVVNGGT